MSHGCDQCQAWQEAFDALVARNTADVLRLTAQNDALRSQLDAIHRRGIEAPPPLKTIPHSPCCRCSTCYVNPQLRSAWK